jgi:hypothetical protein
MARVVLWIVALFALCLPAAASGSDTCLATSATPCTLSYADFKDGEVISTDQGDWYRVNLEAGRSHYFKLFLSEDPGSGATLRRGNLILRNAFGEAIFPTSFPTNTLRYTSPTDQTLYLVVTKIGATNSDVGTYRLRMWERDEERSDTLTTTVFSSDGEYGGTLQVAGDSDWIRFQVTSGFNYNLSLLTVGDRPGVTLPTGVVNVFDSAGRRIGTFTNNSANFDFTSNYTGAAYAEVRSDNLAITNATYALILFGDDFGSSISSAGRVRPGVPTRGASGLGDSDWFALRTLGGSRTYRAQVRGQGVDNLTNTHVCLQIHTSDGTPVTFQCSGGASTATLQFETQANSQPGDLYLSVFTRFDATGTYELFVDPADDRRGDQQTDGLVYPDSAIIGNFEREGDVDWFRFPVSASGTFDILLEGSGTGFGSADSVELRLYSSTGAELAADAGGGTLANLTATNLAAGDYFIGVNDLCLFGAVGCNPGNYRLSVTSNPAPANTAAISAAVLPLSRAVAVGDEATFFATIANAGPETARSCGFSPERGWTVSYDFQPTDAGNRPVGSRNARVDIPSGGAASFVGILRPQATRSGPVPLIFDCANTPPALALPGLNDITLAATNAGGPDPILLSATIGSDGIVNIPGASGTGVFSVATINVGVGAEVEFRGRTTGMGGAVPFLCMTNPTTGACTTALAATQRLTLGAGATATLGVFVPGGGATFAFDPAGRRVLIEAFDVANAGLGAIGATGVAARTQ